jgi:hypothetical protein
VGYLARVEDEERERIAAQVRARRGDAALADATARAFSVMPSCGMESMSAAQRFPTAAWFYTGAELCQSL